MPSEEQILEILETVCDPEIPVLTVRDLGIIREIRVSGEQAVEVVITPTYSGCPAMNTIEAEIKTTLKNHGLTDVKVTTVLSPPWTTAWISEEGKRRLKEYGIAPPVEETLDKSALFGEPKQIQCPHCGSMDTVLVSQFGSTACKALYKCRECLEPFDYFKCH